MSNEMKNIYGDNVSWFCYEGSINLHDNRDLKTSTVDDEFEVYGENEQGQEGSCSVCVVSLLESAHVELDAKDARIAELEEALHRSNFAFRANLAKFAVKCEHSMMEAYERNEKLLAKGGE